MASAIAMPKTPFIRCARKILQDFCIGKRIFVGENADNDWFAKSEYPAIIAEIFGVSRKAAEIKLKNFQFICEAH